MENNNKNLTIWQRLTKAFGPNSLLNQDYPTYNFDRKELLKTTSKQEFEKELLQAQQSYYLANQWTKIENNLYTQAVYYEPTRLASFYDYESMEFTPEIAAALDIYGEESTTPDQYGNILQIYSESKRVKSILEDLFYNILDINTNLQMWTRNTPVREDSVIPLLDGTEITIKDLSDRVKNGEEIWSYAIQDGTNAIVPSKIIWCDLTRKDSELVRVTLDDGTHIDTTPDHEYMLRDGTFKRADELNEGQSLMPFYTLTSIENKNKIAGYEKIYNPKNNRYQYTHRIVANECVTDLEYEKTVNSKWLTHHVNFKKKDNSPKNLRRMTFEDHSILHQKYSEHLKICRNDPYVVKKRMEGIDRYLRSDKRRLRLSKEMSGIYPKYFEQYNNSELHIKHNEIRSEKMLKNWRSNEFVEKTKNNMTIQISDTCLDYISNIIVKNKNYIGIYKLAEMLKKDKNFIPLFKETYGLRKDITKSINSTTLKKVIFRKTNKNYFDFILSLNPNLLSDKNYNKSKAIYLSKVKYETPLNHKVVSIIRLNETSDVYCLEAVGPNGEHDRHNFPICGKDVNGSYSRTSGVFLSNCKYGDNFVYLKLDSEKGIVGCMQLPNIEIERLERGMPAQASRSASEEPAENKGLRFKWKAKDMEFNSWEIAHFRLLGDDRKLPYGSSMLEKARRTWKQLTLAEDAMLIYRTSRAPERRVFKVFVGNMDDADVEPYVQRVANKFKRSQVVDSKTGNVDLRFNQMAVDQDYFIPVRDPAQASPIDTLPGACISLGTEIPLLDGRILKLSEIIDIWDNGGRDLWVYSCDPITGKIAPGQITWAGVTRRDANVVKITLDNGETLVTTPDHKFVHRTNGFVEAQNLSVGDSLMPFYRREEKIRSNTNKYEQVWDNEAQQWVFTHRMVSEFFGETNGVNDLIIDEIDYVNGDVIDYYNHKIVDIEYLEITQDTGTITVDGNEIYHNYHTFATKSGVFIKNSNLSEIADIEYIQKKLLTALRVPKAFLGFEEVVGEGKNLSLQDIRFARTINRIQKAMISELNKIAIIHLFLLGFEDELNNFVLGLTNPSSQADLLRIDVWKEKIALYKEAVTAIEGIAPTSVTWAKKTILGFSDEDVKLDLQQQRVEKAVGAELTNTATIITRTGIFDNVDKLYADKFSDKPASAANQAGAQTGEPIMGGGADMSASMGADMGLPPAGGADLTPEGTKKDNMNILLESESLIDSDSFIDLSKGSNYLGEIEDKLSKLLRD